jgi:hypothetical protein
MGYYNSDRSDAKMRLLLGFGYLVNDDQQANTECVHVSLVKASLSALKCVFILSAILPSVSAIIVPTRL